MHRNIEVTLHPKATKEVVSRLRDMEDVLSLSVLPAASAKPKGDDVLHLTVLNRGIDQVLSTVASETDGGRYSVSTSEIASIIGPGLFRKTRRDVDEAIWEEVETGLRHNGRLTTNFLLLMAIGGILTAIGFVATPQMQLITMIAASIIAPGLEPVAKIPLGLVLRQKHCLIFGLRSSAVGYAVIMLSAVLTFFGLQAVGDASATAFMENELAKGMLYMTPKDWVLSCAAASASILLYLSYRRNVIAGPLIALLFIPAISASGIALLLGETSLALRYAGRFGIEVLVTIVAGALFVFVKRRTVHRRKPIR